MNKTPVKETARRAGPHMRPRQTTSPLTAACPVPGPVNCMTDSGFTAHGPFDPTEIMSTSIEVDLVVSAANHTSRLIQGNLNVDLSAGTWSCAYAGLYPLLGDNYMPAVLIVRGKTPQGGTVILNVPFSYDPSAAPM